MKTNAKVPLDGQIHDGIRVGPRQSNEAWMRVELDDVSVIRLKIVKAHVVRVSDKIPGSCRRVESAARILFFDYGGRTLSSVSRNNWNGRNCSTLDLGST